MFIKFTDKNGIVIVIKQSAIRLVEGTGKNTCTVRTTDKGRSIIYMNISVNEFYELYLMKK